MRNTKKISQMIFECSKYISKNDLTKLYFKIKDVYGVERNNIKFIKCDKAQYAHTMKTLDDCYNKYSAYKENAYEECIDRSCNMYYYLKDTFTIFNIVFSCGVSSFNSNFFTYVAQYEFNKFLLEIKETYCNNYVTIYYW